MGKLKILSKHNPKGKIISQFFNNLTTGFLMFGEVVGIRVLRITFNLVLFTLAFVRITCNLNNPNQC